MPTTNPALGDRLYSAWVSNAWGSELSQAAELNVMAAATSPVIIAQPTSQALASGFGCSLRVVALGAPPLRYQWYRNDLPVAGATNPTYVIVSLGSGNAGSYRAAVSNLLGATLSLPASLVATNASGGGRLWLATNQPVRICDLDGVTPLPPSGYSAQVYAGDSPEGLRPIGAVMPLWSGLLPLHFYGGLVVPNVPAGVTVYVQVRAWESARGLCYEEARAVGGKFGFSPVASGPALASQLVPIADFHLQGGLPFFYNGRLAVGDRLEDGTQQFVLQGAAGFRYLIEKEAAPNVWSPFLVVTNSTGTVTFVDSRQSQNSVGLYRARLLD